MPEIQEVPSKHAQIANHIRDLILRGDLRPGDRVSSKRQLAADWGVSLPTAEKALRKLLTEGLTESRSGSGTYVRDVSALHRRARERYSRARDTGKIYAPDEYARILDAGLVPAPKHVADALGTVEGRAAVRRRRVTLRGEQVAEISTSWFAGPLAERAPLLLATERIKEGTLNYIESCTGRFRSLARDKFTARLADEEEARLLGLKVPLAVLVVAHTVLDEAECPLEFAEGVYPPGRWTYEEEYSLR